MLTTLPYQDVGDVEESQAAKDEIAPFIGRVDKSSRQTSDNHDLVNENGVQHCRPRKPSSKKNIHQK